ncbi:hypothetical protein LVJ94_32810 [Pendulispora rubella]|uniref:Protein-S-isoprenylcysteine O-methyltransferase n=1 Tax=Pendulispora rubella TaxID=2741070 RepID=A0ABZ2KSL5_9BACT
MKHGLLDLAERIFVLGLYGALVVRIVESISADGLGLGNLLLLPSEGLVFFFVLLRRRTRRVSARPGDWALAMVATAAPMLVRACPERALVPEFVAAFVVMMGTLVQLHAKLVLGRSFGCVPAHRGLKEAGPYRFVRHPMYAGYMLSHLAFLSMNASAWNCALYLVCTLLQIPRLVSEERLLGLDEGYTRYRARVRYRLIPGVY